MTKPSRLSPLLWLVLAIGLAGCAPAGRSPESAFVWPTDGWQTSSPEAQGMDSTLLNQMMELIDQRDAPIDSVLVVRHGAIVFEQYRNGYGQESSHHLQSATKSFTSTLVGIAIQQGFIQNVDQQVLDFFPERTIANLDSRKQQLTIKDLLTMSEGMDWHEVDLPYTDPNNSLGQMWKQDDVIQFVLDQPMVGEPGEGWNYNSGTSILLGNIVEQATGQDLLMFARQYLFDPLGIDHLYWEKADQTHYHSDGGLYMVPRDMARLGYLMLNQGRWDGVQILPPDWVEAASTAYYRTPGGIGYGYQWWTVPEDGVFSAQGHYDQAIYVIPKADMVVVFTADVPDDAIHPEDGLLSRYILGACTDLTDALVERSYQAHGLAYDYGLAFTVAELPAPQTDAISESSGLVQFRYFSYPIEILNVWWDDSLRGLGTSAFLDQAFDTLTEAEQRTFDLQQTTEILVDGMQLNAQPFTFEQEGFPLKGAAVMWPCDDSDRIYALTYVTDTGTEAELLARFGELLGSFSCLADY